MYIVLLIIIIYNNVFYSAIFSFRIKYNINYICLIYIVTYKCNILYYILWNSKTEHSEIKLYNIII